jgi:DNA-binding GntR family transcriptional regulator
VKAEADKKGTTASIHNAIREMILNREILPGEKINQISMAAMLEVSRTPIINALHRLESEGLVDRLQNSGFYVHRLSIQELQDLFDLREALDIVIINNLIHNISDDEIETLEEIFANFIESGQEIDREEYRRRDMKFHLTLVSLCRNRLIQKVNDNLQILARSYTAGLIRPYEETLKEHVNVISALRRRDAAKAEAEIRNHITRTKDLIRETVDGLIRMGLDPTVIHVDEISLVK